MQKIIDENIILKIIKYIPTIFIISIVILISFYISYEHKKEFDKKQKRIKLEAIISEKDKIKQDIETAYKYIYYETKKSEDLLKKDLKDRIEIAYKIAINIYNKNKDSLSKEEIISHIKNSVETIRFNKGRGYFSIHTIEGVNILHPINKQFEGNLVLNRKDVKGSYPIKEAINIAKTKGEGFFSWYYFKPNDKSREFKKIGFVKNLEIYNLIITTAEYVDDFEQQVKNKILEHLKSLEFKDKRYFFAINKNGEFLITKTKISNINQINKENPFVKLFTEFIASKKNTTYFKYNFVNAKEEYLKISYLKKINKYDWVIGIGFNLDKLNQEIENKQIELERVHDREEYFIFIIVFFITLTLLIISIFISNFLENLFKEYKNRLNKKNSILNKAQKQAKIGSWEQNLNNDVLICTDEVYNIFEFDVKSDLSFEVFTQVVHPDDKDNMLLIFNKSIEEHKEYYFEHRLLLSNGRIKYVVQRAEHFYDENNIHKATLGTIQDITNKKEIEISLQESEEQYKSLMQESPYAIEIFDKNGLQIAVNKAHGELWGFDTSKTVGKFNILSDEKFKNTNILEYIKKAYAGEVVNIPAHKFNPSSSTITFKGLGKERVIKSNIYPLKDINNKVKNIIITQIDISHEEESKKRDQILTSVFQVLPDFLFIMKRNGEIVDYRAHEKNSLYLSPELFLGKRMQDVLPKDIGKLFIKNIEELRKSENLKIFKYELKIEGKIKYYEARMAKLPLVGHVMAIVRDITEQVLDEQQVLFQASLLEQSLSAINVVDENKLFTYVNDAYVKMWGYDNKEQILGSSPVSHCEDSNMPNIIIEKVEKYGEYLFQFKAKRKNNTIFDALMAVRHIYLMDKKYYIASTIDISEKEKMREDKLKQEKILYQQSKMAAMGEMLGNIAHQWRQPLSTISSAATGSKIQKEMDCLSDEELDKALTAINDSAQYLSKIINDFRNFFNPSNNNISEFLISNTFEKTLDIVSVQFVAKDIEIIKNIDEIYLFSIENALMQVLINILNNAKDALLNLKEEKRYIFIDVYKKKNKLIIEIKDSAKGIPENIIDRVFEPYFTTKYKAQGTGIGLYMSQEIVKSNLNGVLSVENETYVYDDIEYTGAKFIIKIPISN